MKTSEKKKTEIRMEPEFYDKIRNLVYERKFRSLNEAYESLLKLGYEKFMENIKNSY
jgi:hypothetical protein